jgi:hypothetical protein
VEQLVIGLRDSAYGILVSCFLAARLRDKTVLRRSGTVLEASPWA